MLNKKLISTVIPTFNREKYLEIAIKSCLNQSVEHEIIVCNHGGSDDTDNMVKKFNGKIRYIKKDLDFGPIHCWLDGVLEAKGEFINILFDDDWLESNNYIEHCIKYLADPEVGFVFCPAKLYDEKQKNFTDILHNNFLHKDGIYKINKYELNFLGGLISPTAFVMRKKDIIDSLYSGKLPFAKYTYKGVGPDRLMILICMLRYSKFGFLKEPQVVYRSHSNSITINSKTDKDKNENIKNAYAEVDKYYYTMKYGKYFSYLQNKYIFKFRRLLNINYIVSKLTNN